MARVDHSVRTARGPVLQRIGAPATGSVIVGDLAAGGGDCRPSCNTARPARCRCPPNTISCTIAQAPNPLGALWPWNAGQAATTCLPARAIELKRRSTGSRGLGGKLLFGLKARRHAGIAAGARARPFDVVKLSGSAVPPLTHRIGTQTVYRADAGPRPCVAIIGISRVIHAVSSPPRPAPVRGPG